MSGAQAAGFGKLTVLSSLGQPLRAEIELTSVAKDEEGQLTAKLASVDVYKQANLDFSPALMALQFTVDQRGSRNFIRVTSSQPMNEPVVEVLVELGGTKARVIREYTLMLDPAESRTTQSAQVFSRPSKAAKSVAVAPAPALPATTSGVTTTPLSNSVDIPPGARNDRTSASYVAEKTVKNSTAANTTKSTAKSTVAKSDDAATAKSANSYRVKQGDTLASIAGQNLSGSISLDQMLVAMYRSNKQAFIDGNMNRLRSGQILSIPDAGSASSINKTEAKGLVLAQSKDFKNYRSTLAAQVASSSAEKSEPSKQSAGGKITAKVEEKASPTEGAKDKLTLSRSGATNASGATADAKLAASLAAANEEKVAHERAAADADAKIKLLEKNVSDLQKVLEVKNKNLDDLQKQASAVKPVAPAATAAPVAAVVAPVAAAVTPASANTAASASTPAAATATDAASASAAATAAAASSTAVAPAIAPAAPVKPVVKPKAAPVAPAEAPGFFSGLTDNPFLLPAAGVLALLLGGLGISRIRRKQQLAFLNTNGDPATNSALKTNSLFGSTGGQSVDTKNSIFNSNFVPSVSHLDTNVDPVAEADVYIAYGRDAQAEEILKEALRNQPGRNAIRVKLLEIYAARKDTRAFEGLATELYSLTHGEGEDWQQVALLGASIAPANPLYGNANSIGTAVPANQPAHVAAPVAPVVAAATVAAVAPVIAATPVAPVSTAAQEPIFDLPVLTANGPATEPFSMHHEIDFDHAGNSRPASNQDTLVMPLAANKAMFDALDFELDSKPLQETLVSTHDDLPSDETVDFATTTFPHYLGTQYKYEPMLNNSSRVNVASVKADAPSVVHVDTAIPTPPVSGNVEYKLSDVNLDLDSDSKVSPVAEVAHASAIHLVSPAVPVASHEVAKEVTSDHHNPEMATKLDLAVAYQEIGDTDGARELLEEVVKGGNAEQLESAKALLSKLA
ncbi:pilus assembly protein FimV [Glaciimonas sp. GS1]|uniref:Pilus assembly protein FimV n=2 Tax=Glaciimonas soli TaxID=2590999 RepID=A0A843YNM8_9BURK|nr:pilus assembly protein FimV [Glaciimonas soli]